MSERCPGERLCLFAYDRTEGKEKRNLSWQGEKLYLIFGLVLVLSLKFCVLTQKAAQP